MEDQTKAEQQKESSKDVREKLRVQKEIITERTSKVMTELAEVEPAVRDAENGKEDTIYGHIT